jgi:hypothetical protein
MNGVNGQAAGRSAVTARDFCYCADEMIDIRAHSFLFSTPIESVVAMSIGQSMVTTGIPLLVWFIKSAVERNEHDAANRVMRQDLNQKDGHVSRARELAREHSQCLVGQS